MAKPKVLLLGEIDHAAARADYESLSSLADLITTPAKNRTEFIAACRNGDLDGVVAIYRTFPSVAVTGRYDDELLSAFPKSIKWICHNGAGYDQIDVAACTAHKVYVSNVPTAVDAATADTAVFLILGCLRAYNAGQHALRRGEFRGKAELPLGHDPEGKILGILGMGGIGRNLASKMKAFGMKVQYHNRKPLSEEMAAGAAYVGFEELLKTSDVISLNLPLNAHTHHIISTPQFALMKPTAIVVNTARGAVMDEAALVTALNNNQIASAGLDVFEKEPEVHPGLIENERVVLLPHMGTWTEETQTSMEQWCISNVRMALEEGRLRSRVGEQEGLAYD